MVASRSSSEAQCSSEAQRFSEAQRWTLSAALRRLALLLAALVAASVVTGCVTVRPEDKEHLAEPAMTFGDEAGTGAQEQHVFSNREGSFGGGGVSGGGCGCN